MPTVYGVALPKVYILVHFWQRVSAMLKHRFSDRMSVVPNSNEFFIYEKFEVQKCPRTDISERWHPVPLLKTILNVQKARLRLFFTRALYPVSLFSKVLELRGTYGITANKLIGNV